MTSPSRPIDLGRSDACCVCGEPLGCGPNWVVDFPRVAHEACVDWTTWERCPYVERLKALRSMWWRATPEQRDVIRALAWWLRGVRLVWPFAAAELMVETRRRIEIARAELVRLGCTDKRLSRLR
ncbi:MAG: hypothetical protein AAGE52_31280 [Myxococcota bacterium]